MKKRNQLQIAKVTGTTAVKMKIHRKREAEAEERQATKRRKNESLSQHAAALITEEEDDIQLVEPVVADPLQEAESVLDFDYESVEEGLSLAELNDLDAETTDPEDY